MSAVTTAEAGIGCGVDVREVFFNGNRYKVASGNYCTPFAKRVGVGLGSSASRGGNHFYVRSLPITGGPVVAKNTDSGPHALNTSVQANDVDITDQNKSDFTNTKQNLEATPFPLEPMDVDIAKPDHANQLNPSNDGQKTLAHLKRPAGPTFNPDSDLAVQAAVAGSVPAPPPPAKRRKRAAAATGYHRFHVV
jgi:hypothetical protein